MEKGARAHLDGTSGPEPAECTIAGAPGESSSRIVASGRMRLGWRPETSRCYHSDAGRSRGGSQPFDLDLRLITANGVHPDVEWKGVETMGRERQPQPEMLQGMLDMLVLQTLLLGPAHGYAVARTIQQRSDDQLQVGQGSLYPALQRLEEAGAIASFWGTSENNRRARYYRLTPAGRRRLLHETGRWSAIVNAVARVLRPAEEPS